MKVEQEISQQTSEVGPIRSKIDASMRRAGKMLEDLDLIKQMQIEISDTNSVSVSDQSDGACSSDPENKAPT